MCPTSGGGGGGTSLNRCGPDITEWMTAEAIGAAVFGVAKGIAYPSHGNLAALAGQGNNFDYDKDKPGDPPTNFNTPDGSKETCPRGE